MERGNAKRKGILAFRPKVLTPLELVKCNYCQKKKKKNQLCYRTENNNKKLCTLIFNNKKFNCATLIFDSIFRIAL